MKKLTLLLNAVLILTLFASCGKDDEFIDEAIIRFNQSDLVMIEGSREKFLLIADPPESLSTETERNSSNNNVATIDENGTIIARSAEKAFITVSMRGSTNQRTVTVLNRKVESK